ncbi:MAG: riboflavin synthase [Rhodothermales bacterium]|nr:riboflavin synthase [Rhodothermales bacterium]
MFTGIIESTGAVLSVEELGGGRRFRFKCEFGNELRVDESVAVNGACLTVVKQGDDFFEAVAVEETLSKSSLGELEEGSVVNHERAITMNARLDGHIVQGHVDTTGRISGIKTLDTSHEFTIEIDPAYRKYLIPKGSITVDGISLTVANLEARSFMVAIIPHTFKNTNAALWRTGDTVNIEFDMLGKYVVGYLENASSDLKSFKISRESLSDKGS